MFSRLVVLKLVRLLAILFVFGGLVLFSWTVTIDYCKYKTSSIISVRGYSETNFTAPSVSFCVRFDVDPSVESKISRLFSNSFDDKNNSWRLLKVWSKVFPGKKLEHKTKKYFMGNFHNKDSNKDCQPQPSYFGIVSGEASLLNTKNQIIGHRTCARGVDNYRVHLIYAKSVNDKLPPPYDTKCLDYTKGNFLSSYDCYDQCLKMKTSKWGIVPGNTFIDKAKYDASDMDIFPSAYIEREEMLYSLITNRTLTPKLCKKYFEIHSRWKDFKRSCRKSCGRLDCLSEKITPKIRDYEASGGHNNTLLSYLMIILETSDEPILYVTSVPRQHLIDFIVYICSGLSFWLGLCPLDLVDRAEKKLNLYISRTRRGRRMK